MPTPVLVLLVVLAVAGGLYVGYAASRSREAVEGKAAPKSLGARARDAAGRGVVELWRWNRARKKKAREREPR
ncbi:hypothetical protein [Paraliomyxa miuraensis]|uniref:hypothetical protein n=1 Tax=Paraliomyxa miuraensis TaxID=376150 RepID=UPI002250E886|nr:hypothetical protein [Paraliomyxa miuraensis]MCX4241622.1 hypothetical protein [Paraliomyxa miuraensis]